MLRTTLVAAPPSNVTITDSGLTANIVRFSDTAILTCSAAGTAPLQYAWYYKASNRYYRTPLPGANSTTYTVYSAKSSDVGEYTCEVSNWAGKSSRTYTLNVQSKYQLLHMVVTYMLHACTASTLALLTQPIIIMHSDERVTNIWSMHAYITYVCICMCCECYLLSIRIS